MKNILVGNRKIGKNSPCFVIAEIGINHNGDINTAKKLIDIANDAGCDAVKFQKRTPDLCVPAEQRDLIRETPWGLIKYIDYRYRVEFGLEEYQQIDRYCKSKDILWFASCWDIEAVDFIAQFNPCCYKVASACLTNDSLLKKISDTNVPLILSTGMSSIEEISHAVSLVPKERLILTQATSSYPCAHNEINLNVIKSFQDEFDCLTGYSGHEIGLQISIAAVAMGACLIERHITLDRAMWGSDHAASLEPQGIKKLVRDIRIVEEAMGDGIKKIYESEMSARKKLRR